MDCCDLEIQSSLMSLMSTNIMQSLTFNIFIVSVKIATFKFLPHRQSDGQAAWHWLLYRLTFFIWVKTGHTQEAICPNFPKNPYTHGKSHYHFLQDCLTYWTESKLVRPDSKNLHEKLGGSGHKGHITIIIQRSISFNTTNTCTDTVWKMQQYIFTLQCYAYRGYSYNAHVLYGHYHNLIISCMSLDHMAAHFH